MSSPSQARRWSVSACGKENAAELVTSRAMTTKNQSGSADHGAMTTKNQSGSPDHGAMPNKNQSGSSDHDIDTPLLQRIKNMLHTSERKSQEASPAAPSPDLVWASPVEMQSQYVSLLPKPTATDKGLFTFGLNRNFVNSGPTTQLPVDTIEPGSFEVDSSNMVESSNMDDINNMSCKSHITARRKSRVHRRDKNISPIEIKPSISFLKDTMETEQEMVTLDTTNVVASTESAQKIPVAASRCHVVSRKRTKQRKNSQSEALSQQSRKNQSEALSQQSRNNQSEAQSAKTVSPIVSMENNNSDKNHTKVLFNCHSVTLNDVHSASKLSANHFASLNDHSAFMSGNQFTSSDDAQSASKLKGGQVTSSNDAISASMFSGSQFASGDNAHSASTTWAPQSGSLNDVHSTSMLAGIPQELIDSIHLPFDDEAPQPKRKAKVARRKSRRSMDFVQLPPPILQQSPEAVPLHPKTIQPSPEAVQLPPKTIEPNPEVDCPNSVPTSRPSKVTNNRRRRTADFEVMATVLSPTSPDLEEMPLNLPAPRRSRRLKRQSIELYRSSVANREEESSLDSPRTDSPEVATNLPVGTTISHVTNVGVTMGKDESMTADGSMKTGVIVSMETDPPVKAGSSPEVPAASDCQVWPSTSAEDQSTLDTAMILDSAQLETSTLSESAILDKAMFNMCLDAEQSLSESLLENSLLDSSTEEPPKRTRRKTASNAPNYTPEKKNNKGTKRKREVSIEDVYLNKLWKTQLDKFPTLETIHEEPHKNKLGQEDFFGGRKCKRFVNYDDFNSQPRLKRRRKKAMMSGWKPLTKKQHEKADRLILEKITLLDEEIRKIANLPEVPVAENAVFDNPIINDPQSDAEEMFYTPYKVLTGIGAESGTACDQRSGDKAVGYHDNEELARPLSTMIEEEEGYEDFMTPMKEGGALETSSLSETSLSPTY